MTQSYPASSAANPFFRPWTGPFGLPPFEDIAPEHMREAFEAGMKAHDSEIAAIAEDARAPDFDNVVGALERAGQDLQRVGGVFWNLSGTDATPEMMALEREISPKLAAHFARIGLNEKLFQRVEEVWRAREGLTAQGRLTPEQRRLLELTYDSFIRSGARLSPEQKKRYAEISERLATLGAQFSQNILKDENDWILPLQEEEMEGLPSALKAAAAHLAEERGCAAPYAISLSRSSVEPFLQFAARRDLREKAFAAWTRRGEMNAETDNRPIIAEILRLRDESARMLGYPTYAHFKLADQMAQSPDQVRELLDRVWKPARAQALRERDALQDIFAKDAPGAALAAHDWRYYAEKKRKEAHNLDDSEVRPYFALDNVAAAAFDVAQRLFGVTFAPVKDVKLYHPDARAFDVRDAQGRHVALFIADYFARPGKRSGAWMSNFRPQHNLAGSVRPIVINVMNFSKGRPALVSLDDARTLFHEFGHALHGILSDVTYPSMSGTGVVRDFVEFPSQLYEHWLMREEVLNQFAKHAETGAPIPPDLVARIMAARNFQQGFATVEYLASAYIDLAAHLEAGDASADIDALERRELARIGMPPEIAMRHRPPHFSHVFAGSGYASGYYSYLWSGVLDADGFQAFVETGDVFDPATAERLKKFVYSAGGREAAEDAYRQFRGRDPNPQALIEQRGFAS